MRMNQAMDRRMSWTIYLHITICIDQKFGQEFEPTESNGQFSLSVLCWMRLVGTSRSWFYFSTNVASSRPTDVDSLLIHATNRLYPSASARWHFDQSNQVRWGAKFLRAVVIGVCDRLRYMQNRKKIDEEEFRPFAAPIFAFFCSTWVVLPCTNFLT